MPAGELGIVVQDRVHQSSATQVGSEIAVAMCVLIKSNKINRPEKFAVDQNVAFVSTSPSCIK